MTTRPVFALVFWISNITNLGMVFAAHIQFLTGVSPAGSSKEEQTLRAWARFGFIRSIPVQSFIHPPQTSAEKGQKAVRVFTAFRRCVAQLGYLDHHDEDYQEAETVPPHSVLDVYRQTATSGHSGSQTLNVLDRLTA